MTVSGIMAPAQPMAAAAAGPAPTDEEKRLRKSAQDLEGLFVAQLFKAMRATVPSDEGAISGGAGEEIFTGLMDEHIAAETPKHWGGGLSEALYRQLRHGLPAASETGLPATSSTVQDVPSSYPLGR
jgi:flagellar protein FlgJ